MIRQISLRLNTTDPDALEAFFAATANPKVTIVPPGGGDPVVVTPTVKALVNEPYNGNVYPAVVVMEYDFQAPLSVLLMQGFEAANKGTALVLSVKDGAGKDMPAWFAGNGEFAAFTRNF